MPFGGGLDHGGDAARRDDRPARLVQFEPDVRGKETGWEGWMVWGGDEWTTWGWGEAGQEGDGGSDGDEGAATEEKVQAVGVGGGENGQAA